MDLKDIVKDNVKFLDKIENSCNGFEKECDSYFGEIEKFLATGNADFFGPLSSSEENAEPVDTGKSKRGGRTKKPLLAEITETDDPREIENSKTSVVVKKEAEEMPAPTKLPPRKKKIKAENLELPKRTTRSRTRNRDNDSRESRSSKKTSDVIIESVPVPTIELSDSDKEESEAEPEKTAVRATRSKARKQNEAQPAESVATLDQNDVRNERSTRTKDKKGVKSDSQEVAVVEAEKKESRSNSGVELNPGKANDTVETEYEDAVSSAEPAEDQINATYVAAPKESSANTVPSMNSTVVVENPKMVLKEMTEREQTQEDVSQEPPKKTTGAVKKILSHHENTSLKKKVELPTKPTGAIKKALKSKEPPEEKGSKAVTPVMPRFQPKVCSTSRAHKLPPSHGGDGAQESVLSVKSASALKASQAEFRERERRRQEKEREALLKREALLQAQAEEKRRVREERQRRAQEHREQLQREKQRQLEAQRAKEEKYKQLLVEREEKLQKQYEEAERKRAQAKKKAEQQREREEETRRCAEARAAIAEKKQQQLPVYMTTKAPMLPTEDCYDSDDPEYERSRRVEPSWSTRPELEKQQMAMICCGESIKNSFFCRQTHTPDLKEIFESIDPRKLKRTSSAIWRKPPRYTLMPNLDNSIFSEESD